MRRALLLGATARLVAPPNPWVGCVLVSPDGATAGEGATAAPGGPHAEAAALAVASGRARGGTAYVTLEPCSHFGRTPPCADALIDAGIRRVVLATVDPDPQVAGAGVNRLRSAGIEVSAGVLEAEARAQLQPYLVHRLTGRPYVVLKLAITLDGHLGAPDRSSRWITGSEAREDGHRLRAESDAVLVGAGTVRADDPELTARLDGRARQPLRVVLGRAPQGARILPALEMEGDLAAVLDELGRRGVLQLLIEGGSHVAGEFHRRGFVDRYAIYVAPVLLGGDDGIPMFHGPGVPTMDDAFRGKLIAAIRLGDDVRFDVEPRARFSAG